ncbi:MAG: DNA-directed RNA polymerase subunit omega [Clostridiales bacterium]|jgi:DNA-directed RNA polymerase subunit omega|nr:DNA-directed RNA polymerase subunit omega [Clostridiales bacterium]
MLKPSYSDLIEELTNSGQIEPNVASRYTIVIAAAKRARLLIDGDEPLSVGNIDKAVSLAVKEMFEGHIKIDAYQGNNLYEEMGPLEEAE